jgi:pyruvate dehydrogenase E2 component (dihydrolipoamide acetyltransferase)
MHKLHLPRLGQTMERGIIEQWLKREGESFEVGEPLYELQTEKVTIEVEAKLPGTLARIVVPAGEEVPVGTLLAIAADPGEMLSDADIEAALEEEVARGASPPIENESSKVVPPPVGDKQQRARVRAMPRARALAKELGVDLAAVRGTGTNGSITVEDVERAAATHGEGSTRTRPGVKERRPLRGIRRSMADVVSRSWREVPQFVQQVTVDAGALVTTREREGPALQEEHGITLSYNDLILDAVVRAVRQVPDVNASFAGHEIVIYEDVNLSVAVASDAGLVVPVIHRAQELSLPELARRVRDVAERARSGLLGPEDVEGGTITVSNLGMFGIETGTPLVTAPQAAIVFTGAIVERAVVVAGEIQVRPTFGLAIAYDHRVLDGVGAARFTRALKEILESFTVYQRGEEHGLTIS